MLILALDTCDARGSVALLQDERVLQTAVHNSSEDYSVWLLPAVGRVLRGAQVDMRSIDLYAAAAGPGSFTALRVGLTSVKAWSEVYGKPIAAVPRLVALIAQASRGAAPYVAAFTDAQRGQVFGAVYRRQNTDTETVLEPAVIAREEFVVSAGGAAGSDPIEWISPDPKCVTHTEAWKARQSRGEAVQVIAPVLAPAVGHLGLAMARQNQLIDALALDANYVRRTDAELFWKGGARREPQR